MISASPLQNKRVLVTGSGTGIGRGIAIECARAGAVVAVHYSRSTEGADEVVRTILDAGGSAKAFAADFTEPRDVDRLADQALDFLDGVDVLVNNAGITFNTPFERVTLEQFDALYAVNVRAGFMLTQRLLDSLKRRKGNVIHITSVHAFEGMREHSVYAGTKGAIVAYTRALAIELAPLGVRVNAIAPGCVPVANYESAVGKYDVDEMGRGIPAGYVGTPEDIARAVVFLASDDARFILGQTLVIDGGTTSWMPFGEQFRQPLADQGIKFGRGYISGT